MAEDDNRKRAMPEPVAHAMIINEFPIFKQKTDYLELVLCQLEGMKLDKNGNEIKAVADAIKLCKFFNLGVHNNHNTAGIEQIKQLFIKEASSTKEAISKSGVVKDLGGGEDGNVG